jgi:dolichyl-diphosphooligosaccharide---protein glycosyltransferase subunit 1 (ribophorin I)
MGYFFPFGEVTHMSSRDVLCRSALANSTPAMSLCSAVVTLGSPLAAGESVKITVDFEYLHALVPFPASIAQAERQLVVYTGNVYFFSEYVTEKQRTVVVLASDSVESYTDEDIVGEGNVVVEGSEITYGAFENIAPNTYKALRIHSVNNKPFITVTSSVTDVEVSHWGGALLASSLVYSFNNRYFSPLLL